MLLDQLRCTFPSSLRSFITEQGATGLADVVKLADRYAEAHEHEGQHRSSSNQSNRHSKDKNESLKANGSKDAGRSQAGSHAGQKEGSNSKANVVCSFCEKPGHTVDKCYKRKRVEKSQDKILAMSSYEEDRYTTISRPQLPTDIVIVNGLTHSRCNFFVPSVP